jgi:hypothetical protein
VYGDGNGRMNQQEGKPPVLCVCGGVVELLINLVMKFLAPRAQHSTAFVRYVFEVEYLTVPSCQQTTVTHDLTLISIDG